MHWVLLACMLSLLCAGSPGAISVQEFLPYHKALQGKRGLDVSNCPLFSPLRPPSSWDAAYFPLLAAVKAASELLGLLCSWGVSWASCICTDIHW